MNLSGVSLKYCCYEDPSSEAQDLDGRMEMRLQHVLSVYWMPDIVQGTFYSNKVMLHLILTAAWDYYWGVIISLILQMNEWVFREGKWIA